jgi:hypothetical protein
MARKRHSDQYCLRLLREIEVHLSGGSDVGAACRAVGISDATYYTWRKSKACDTGKGWQAYKEYCTLNAAYSARPKASLGIDTLQDCCD